MKKSLIIFCGILFFVSVFHPLYAQDDLKKEDRIRAKEAKQKMKEAQKQEKKELRERKKEDMARAREAKRKMRLAMAKQRQKAKERAGELSWKDYREKADELFFQSLYYDAIPYYKKVHELKPGKICAPCKIAESYYLTRNYQKAEDWFQEVLKIDSTKNKYPIVRFFYALNIKAQGRYENAIRELNKFMGQNRGKIKKSGKIKRDPMAEYLRLARRERFGCEMGIAMRDTFTMSKYSVKHLDEELNKKGFEISPAYIDQKQFLFAQMPASIYSSEIKDNLQSKKSKIYTAINISGFWRNDGEVSGKVNEGEIHTMDPAFSPDSRRIYYSKCKLSDPGFDCKISFSEVTVSGWSEEKELGPEINVEGYSSMQPYLTLDEDSNEILYFVSDRPGGRGQNDIWYSVRLPDGSFKRARNAGGIINTDRNEMTPYFDRMNNTLYFSSNGHANIGGLDIFRSVLNDYGGWEKPTNMQMPVNSPADDWYFVMDKQAYNGYFASNRPQGNSEYGETCCDDIYSFKMAEPALAVKGKIFEEYGGERIKSTYGAVTLFSASNDSMIGSYSIEGKDHFIFDLKPDNNYFLITSKDGFDDVIYEFTTKNVRFSDTLNIDLILEKEEIDRSWIGEVIGTVYFEYDRFRLKSEAASTMDSVIAFAITHPEYLYEVGGHTDNKGPEEYNRKLSLDRAIAVRKYVISKGVDPEKIVAVGYGESKPKKPNTLPDGSDNKEGREKNRRVEFKITGEAEL